MLKMMSNKLKLYKEVARPSDFPDDTIDVLTARLAMLAAPIEAYEPLRKAEEFCSMRERKENETNAEC